MPEDLDKSGEKGLEAKIYREESYLQSTANRLAAGIEKLDRTKIDMAREDLVGIMDEIQEKYERLNSNLTLIAGIGAAGVMSFVLEVNPYAFSVNLGNWKELIAKEAVVAGLYAATRLASWLYKQTKEAKVARTLDGAINKDFE